MTRRLLPLLPLLAFLGAAGCAGYRLGPTNGELAGSRSVEIAFFQNVTPQSRLVEAVNTALRRAVQQDGTYRLATRGDGDILVTGVITKYERPPLSFEPADTLTVRDYRIVLTARVTAKERATGRVIFEREVRGTTVIRPTGDQSGVERQALPLVADDLARRATGLLADGTF